MVDTKTCLYLVLAIFPSAILLSGSARAASPTISYFWVVPSSYLQHVPKEGFVIAVGSAGATRIYDILNNGHQPGFSGYIASGSVDYNKNYYAPGHPLWNWHVESIVEIFDFSDTLFPACECPYLIANPSDIAANPDAWITRNGYGYTPTIIALPAKSIRANLQTSLMFPVAALLGRAKEHPSPGLSSTAANRIM